MTSGVFRDRLVEFSVRAEEDLPFDSHCLRWTQIERRRVKYDVPAVVAPLGEVALDAVGVETAFCQDETETVFGRSHTSRLDTGYLSAAPDVRVAALCRADRRLVVAVVEGRVYPRLAAPHEDITADSGTECVALGEDSAVKDALDVDDHVFRLVDGFQTGVGLRPRRPRRP